MYFADFSDLFIVEGASPWIGVWGLNDGEEIKEGEEG